MDIDREKTRHHKAGPRRIVQGCLGIRMVSPVDSPAKIFLEAYDAPTALSSEISRSWVHV